jgi:hypothetical protein
MPAPPVSNSSTETLWFSLLVPANAFAIYDPGRSQSLVAVPCLDFPYRFLARRGRPELVNDFETPGGVN